MTIETVNKPYVHVVDYDGPTGAPPTPLRVPWVAEWSGELGDDPVQPFQLGDGITIGYTDERPSDRILGVLWMRTNVDRSGDPRFAKLNVHRQRDAMIGRLCQVCGLPAGDTWLIPPIERVRSGPLQTSVPPTCEACVPVARRQCPHLGVDAGVLLQVRHYRMFAVWGDIVELTNGRVRHYQGEFRLADPRSTTNILGRQLVVEIYDYRRRRES